MTLGVEAGAQNVEHAAPIKLLHCTWAAGAGCRIKGLGYFRVRVSFFLRLARAVNVNQKVRGQASGS